MSRARRRKPWAFCVSIVLMMKFRFSFVRVSGAGGRVVGLVDMNDGESGGVMVSELSFHSMLRVASSASIGTILGSIFSVGASSQAGRKAGLTESISSDVWWHVKVRSSNQRSRFGRAKMLGTVRTGGELWRCCLHREWRQLEPEPDV